jgi:TRAP-type mannitol/chloroaromatic compound transport system permease small subunit
MYAFILFLNCNGGMDISRTAITRAIFIVPINLSTSHAIDISNIFYLFPFVDQLIITVMNNSFELWKNGGKSIDSGSLYQMLLPVYI